MDGYTIKSGDSLWKIVKQEYNTTNSGEIRQIIDKIAEINDIENPNLIYAGTRLELPDPGSIFGTGETLPGQNTGDAFVREDAGNIPVNYTPQTLQPEGQTGYEAGQTYPTELYEGFNIWTEGQTAGVENYVSGKMAAAGDTYTYEDFEKDYAEALQALGQEEFRYANAPQTMADALMGTAQIASEHIAMYDAGNDGGIDKDDFINKSLEEAGVPYNEETAAMLENSFNFFDINQDGSIDVAETMAYYAAMDFEDSKMDGSIQFSSYAKMSEAGTNAANPDRTHFMASLGVFYEKIMGIFTAGAGGNNQPQSV